MKKVSLANTSTSNKADMLDACKGTPYTYLTRREGVDMPTMKRLRKAAKAQGWEVTTTGSGHVLFTSPSGERVILGSTPSDSHRGWLNDRALLRRAGFDNI